MELLKNAEFEAKCAEMAKRNDYNLYDIVFIDKDGKAYHYQHTPANRSNNSYSATKMFTMTAIGLLWDEGKIKLEDKVCDYLRKYIKTDYDPNWEKVTVAHALGHSMGIDRGYLDIDAEDCGEDHITEAFKKNLTYEPGTTRVYSDAAYYILTRVATEACGEPLDNYLSPRLFRPLKFQEIAMTKCPLGYVVGGTGLYCPTADMAKLGSVYLNNGMFEGQRIVSEEWVKLVEKNEYGLDRCEARSYGKTGAHGQMIAYSHETNKVVAFHAYQCGNYDFRGEAIREFCDSDYTLVK